MSLPALAQEPGSLAAVDGQCAAIEAWAEQCESVPEIRDAGHKLAAIDQYLARTSTEGRARVAEAQRRLEVRIGVLIGPAGSANQHTAEPLSTDNGTGLSRRQRHDFRKMAEHPDVVDQVVAESTDEAPASRRKVLDAIKAKTADLVAEEQAKREERAESKKVWDELRDQFEVPDHWDPDLDREMNAQLGSLDRHCTDLVALGEPAEFVARHHAYLTEFAPHFLPSLTDTLPLAEQAHAWLGDLVTALKEHQ